MKRCVPAVSLFFHYIQTDCIQMLFLPLHVVIRGVELLGWEWLGVTFKSAALLYHIADFIMVASGEILTWWLCGKNKAPLFRTAAYSSHFLTEVTAGPSITVECVVVQNCRWSPVVCLWTSYVDIWLLLIYSLDHLSRIRTFASQYTCRLFAGKFLPARYLRYIRRWPKWRWVRDRTVQHVITNGGALAVTDTTEATVMQSFAK